MNPVAPSWSVEKSPLNLFFFSLKEYLFVEDKYCLQKAELIFIRGCASVRVNGVAETGQRLFLSKISQQGLEEGSPADTSPMEVVFRDS